MTTGRMIRLELHSDGRATVVEQTTDQTRALELMTEHFARYRDTGTVGQLVLIDGESGRVVSRRKLRGITRP